MCPSAPSSPTATELTQPDTSHLRRPLRSSSRRQVSRANSRRILHDPTSAAELARATSVITNTKVSLKDAMAMAFSIKPGSTQDTQTQGAQVTSPKAASASASSTKQGQAARAAGAGSASAADSPRAAAGQNQGSQAQRNKPRMPRPSASSRNLKPGSSRPQPVRSATFISSSSSLSREAELHQLRMAALGAPTTSTSAAMLLSGPALPATQLLPALGVEQAAVLASFEQLQLGASVAQPSGAHAHAPASCQPLAGAWAMEQRCSSAAPGHSAAPAEPAGWSCWSSDFSSCLQQAAGM